MLIIIGKNEKVSKSQNPPVRAGFALTGRREDRSAKDCLLSAFYKDYLCGTLAFVPKEGDSIQAGQTDKSKDDPAYPM